MSEQPYYETMYILRPDIPEDEVESHLSKFSDIIVKAGGEVLDNQTRGKRRLAYPIAKHKEGIYVQLSHIGNGEHIAIFEKSMRLSEDIIRYLTVKQDGPLPEKKAPKSNEKDDKDQSLENKEKKSEETKSEEKKSEEKKSKETKSEEKK